MVLKNHLIIFSTVFAGIFAGWINVKAQESKEILELKGKLNSAKSPKDKHIHYLRLADAYGMQGKTDSVFAFLTRGEENAKKMNDTDEAGRINIFISQFFLQKGDVKNSEKYINEAHLLLANSKNYDNLGLLNYATAGLYILKKQYAKATENYKKNIRLYDEGKKIDKKYVTIAYQGLFANLIIQNNLRDGYLESNKYIDYVKKNEPEKLDIAYLLLGSFYMNAKDYDKSLNAYQKTIALSKNQDLVNLCNAFLGILYAEKKELDLAKKYTDKANAFFKGGNNNIALGSVYYSYASIFLQENKLDLAEEYIKKAIAISPEKDISSTRFSYLSKQNEILVKKLTQDRSKINDQEKKVKLEQLLKDLKENLSFIESTDTFLSPELIISNFDNLSKVYEELGNYEQSLFYQKKYVQKKDEAYGLDKMKEFLNTQSDYELREQKAKIELQEATKRIQLQKELELKALKFEYEKKQAATKTEAERKRLLLEEDLKRREIELTYAQQKKEAEQKYIQEKKLAKINQEKKDAIAKAELENSKSEKNMWAIGAGLSLLLLGFAGFSYNQKRKDNKRIAEEKQKSENLLLNILPHEVAEELKENGKTNAKHFDEVSVLFTDFVNFTANSERIGVQEVLNELNICFTEFDKIMDKYNLEKIKTIGDAYLAVSGLPVSNEHHAENAVNAGLEILDYIQKRKENNPNALDIRIGIHSGPVIAGIVGVKKFAYDIWGDTVNTAARMEQNSQKGKLNISGFTYDLIKNKFICEYRGKIEVKGKGELDMYFVEKI